MRQTAQDVAFTGYDTPVWVLLGRKHRISAFGFLDRKRAHPLAPPSLRFGAAGGPGSVDTTPYIHIRIYWTGIRVKCPGGEFTIYASVALAAGAEARRRKGAAIQAIKSLDSFSSPLEGRLEAAHGQDGEKHNEIGEEYLRDPKFRRVVLPCNHARINAREPDDFPGYQGINDHVKEVE